MELVLSIVDDSMEADLNASLRLTVRKGWTLGTLNDSENFGSFIFKSLV